MAIRPKRREKRNHVHKAGKPKQKDAFEARQDRLGRQRDVRDRTDQLIQAKRHQAISAASQNEVWSPLKRSLEGYLEKSKDVLMCFIMVVVLRIAAKFFLR